MKVVGIQLVRNEADILRVNLRYHLSLGLDEMLVLDNGSSDGSAKILEEVARSAPVIWQRDDRTYWHGGLLTKLAHEAHDRGADWIIPIDVDEFWQSPSEDIREVLASTRAAALRVRVENFVQRRRDVPTGARALMTMDHRARPGVEGFEMNERATEAGEIAYVEIHQVPKTVIRATGGLEVSDGSHNPEGLDGTIEDTSQIVVLHAPVRRPAVLEEKAERGGRIIERGFEPPLHWHERRWFRLREERGGLDEEWAANSQEGGALNVYGARRPVEPDERLRNAVRPWIDPPGGTKEWSGRLDELAARTGEIARLRAVARMAGVPPRGGRGYTVIRRVLGRRRKVRTQ